MSEKLQQERERLTQVKLLEWLNRDVSAVEMVTVWLSDDQEQHNHWGYCALVPSARTEESLAMPDWDLRHGGGLPGACIHGGGGRGQHVEYLRFGIEHFEPLVIYREFDGIKPNYVELSEEFRLFHRLYHDNKDGQFLKIEDDGSETLVATIEPNRVQVRLKELRQFLAIKEMHLAVQFDCREHSSHTLERLGLEAGGGDHRDGLCCWGLSYGSYDGLDRDHASFSRLLGKCLIPPLPKEKSGFWGYAREEPKKYEAFVIGVDENGDHITCTSDPSGSADPSGAERGSAPYLTGVHFQKSVLDKYYNHPAKYSVEDSILRCGSLWTLTMDNHHDDKVCAWLGDLGSELPHSEQLHWRSHNIPPTGGVSEIFFRRQMMCQFIGADRPELVFHEQFHKLKSACDMFLGWQLLLPLAVADLHYFKGLRVPSTDDQKDFDEVVLGLTKILIDSLNEEEFHALIAPGGEADPKRGIALLEAVFVAREVKDYEEHISFLRNLQKLRSSGSAHRKGDKYRKISLVLGVDSQKLSRVFCGILEHAISFLEYLTTLVNGGKISVNRATPSVSPEEEPKS